LKENGHAKNKTEKNIIDHMVLRSQKIKPEDVILPKYCGGFAFVKERINDEEVEYMVACADTD
jgi:hypothetical protein